MVLWLVVTLLVGCDKKVNDEDYYDSLFRENRQRVMFVDNEHAVSDAHEMLDKAKKDNSRYGKVLAYLSLSSLSAQSGDYDDMRHYMEVARASLDVSDPPFLQGYAYLVEGVVDYSTRQSINSLLCFDKALLYFKPLGDSLMIASSYINKCNYFYVNGNKEAASSCIDSAIRWSPQCFCYTVRLYEAMRQNYEGGPQEAIVLYDSIVRDAMSDSTLPTWPTACNTRFWTLLYSNYIFATLMATDFEETERQYKSMDSIVRLYGSEFDYTNSRVMRAWIEAYKGNIDTALSICKHVYDSYNGFHQMTVRREVVNLMSQCYNEIGDYRMALKFSKEETRLRTNNATDALMLEEIVDRQQGYENHIRELEIKAVRTRTWLVVIVLLTVLLAVLFFFYRQRRRLMELEHEKKLYEQQSQLNSAKMEQAAAREQMSSFTGEVRRMAIELPKHLRVRMLQGISRMEEQQRRDAWDEFAENFEMQHPDFVAKLRERYSLQPIEVKICMLIRMGFSNREIADTLHLADNTVRTYRTRIRKKMNLLEESADLNVFIASI